MKTAFAGFAVACAIAPLSALAQTDTGRVISARPVVQNVPVPRQVCSGQPPVCTTQTFNENRAVAYDVTYEYAGRQYTTQMASDPGPTIRLQIGPVAAGPMSAPPPTAPATQAAPTEVPAATIIGQEGVPAPVAVAPTVVYAEPYPVYEPYPYPYAYGYPYYARPYYGPSFGISINAGRPYYRGGPRGPFRRFR